LRSRLPCATKKGQAIFSFPSFGYAVTEDLSLIRKFQIISPSSADVGVDNELRRRIKVCRISLPARLFKLDKLRNYVQINETARIREMTVREIPVTGKPKVNAVASLKNGVAASAKMVREMRGIFILSNSIIQSD